jgi:thioredoxin 1
MDSLSYLLPGLFLLFIVSQFVPAIRSKLMQGRPAPEIGEAMGEMARRQSLLIYFFSPGCMMCKSMSPIIDRLAERHGNVMKVDVAASSQSLDLARKFGVRGTPTTVLVRRGMIEQVLIGAKSARQLEGLLKRQA